MEYPEGYTYPGLPRLYNPALLDGFREHADIGTGRAGNRTEKIKQPASQLYETVGSLKVITRLVKYARVKEEDSGPSCSLAEALEKQDLFINSTLAQLGCNILWKMFRNGMIEHHGVFLNLGTMKVNPILI